MSKVSFIKSVMYAFKGISQGISKQRMLKVLLLLGFFSIFISLVLQVSKEYLITILIAVFLVIILELFNNNFERLIDLVSPEHNKEAGEIKDTMAGVVLLAFILLIIVSFLILYNPLISTLKLLATCPPALALLAINVFFILIILFAHTKKKNSRPNNSRVNNKSLY